MELDTQQGIIVELILAVSFELGQLVFIFLWGAVTIECLLLLFKIVDSDFYTVKLIQKAGSYMQ